MTGLFATSTFPMPNQGNTCCFLKNVIKKNTISIGDYTYYHDTEGADRFEQNNVLYHWDFSEDKLIIGKFCQMAMGTTFIISGSMHQMDGFSTCPFFVFNEALKSGYEVNLPFKGDTVVGNDVWFGNNARIMPGVKIGDGAIIGTNSLITKDVEPYTIVGGNPARVIRKRFDDETMKSGGGTGP